MKVLVVYGGSGLVNDPSKYTIERIISVLKELEVETEQINLYEQTYNIDEFLNSLSGSDGVVLATTIEWLGIGGYMQTFLDQCYKYGDMEAFKGNYLMAVVLSKQQGERDGLNHMIKSWEMIGGLEGINICGTVKSSVDLETNAQFVSVIDKKTEDYYRILHQKRDQLPTSIRNPIYTTGSHHESIEQLELQGLEEQDNMNKNQISFLSNDYAAHHQDIKKIANLFKQQLDNDSDTNPNPYMTELKNAFKGANENESYRYLITIQGDAGDEIGIIIRNGEIDVISGTIMNSDVVINLTDDIMNQILEGKISAQRAFMTGQLSAKGNIRLVHEFDKLFDFE